MIVIDSSVLGDLLFNGGDLQKSAEQLQEIDPEWICLDLVRYELGNIAWKYGKLLGANLDRLVLGLAGAELAVTEIVSDLNLRKILELSVKEGLTFYDASHVWLARERGLRLRTRDKEILRKCPDVADPMP